MRTLLGASGGYFYFDLRKDGSTTVISATAVLIGLFPPSLELNFTIYFRQT